MEVAVQSASRSEWSACEPSYTKARLTISSPSSTDVCSHQPNLLASLQFARRTTPGQLLSRQTIVKTRGSISDVLRAYSMDNAALRPDAADLEPEPRRLSFNDDLLMRPVLKSVLKAQPSTNGKHSSRDKADPDAEWRPTPRIAPMKRTRRTSDKLDAPEQERTMIAKQAAVVAQQAAAEVTDLEDWADEQDSLDWLDGDAPNALATNNEAQWNWQYYEDVLRGSTDASTPLSSPSLDMPTGFLPAISARFVQELAPPTGINSEQLSPQSTKVKKITQTADAMDGAADAFTAFMEPESPLCEHSVPSPPLRPQTRPATIRPQSQPGSARPQSRLSCSRPLSQEGSTCPQSRLSCSRPLSQEGSSRPQPRPGSAQQQSRPGCSRPQSRPGSNRRQSQPSSTQPQSRSGRSQRRYSEPVAPGRLTEQRDSNQLEFKSVGADFHPNSSRATLADSEFSIGACRVECSMMSRRGGKHRWNQDGAMMCRSEKRVIIAVCDGHGPHGHRVAELAMKSLASDSAESDQQSVEQMMQGTEETLLEHHSDVTDESGVSCCVVELTSSGILCANVGNCRALFIPTGQEVKKQEVSTGHVFFSQQDTCQDDESKAVELAFDHNANHPAELDRLRAAGFQPDEHGTLWSETIGWNFTRSIGDSLGKRHGLSACPEVNAIKFCDQSKSGFVVIASDGIFNFLSNDDITQIIRAHDLCDVGFSLDSLCRSIVNTALVACKNDNIQNDADDITVLVARVRVDIE